MIKKINILDTKPSDELAYARDVRQVGQKLNELIDSVNSLTEGGEKKILLTGQDKVCMNTTCFPTPKVDPYEPKDHGCGTWCGRFYGCPLFAEWQQKKQEWTTLQTTPKGDPYEELDHSHCWEQKKPACGQKIKHFECCLCKKQNPEIFHALSHQKEEIWEKINELGERYIPQYGDGYYSGVKDSLRILDEIK